MSSAKWRPFCLRLNVLTHWGRHFPDDIFKCIFFLNENVWISIKISQKFVCKGPINNIPALVQKMAWHRRVSLVQSFVVGGGWWPGAQWEPELLLKTE